MTYDRFLKAEDIPTVRRLDYIVNGTDIFESGKLYAVLRNLVILNNYINYENDEVEVLDQEFQGIKVVIVPKLEWVNRCMEVHNKEVIFTSIDNWRAVGEDYNYFWNLKTEKHFIREEAEARLGISERKPVSAIYLEEYEEQICEMMETLKSEL